jgi:histidinol-phosphatase
VSGAARYERELEVARRAVERAGALTLEYFGAKFTVEYKADATPVTIADRGAETLIRDELTSAFPADGIVGEEFPEKIGTSGRRWIIDPIDGTASFVRAVPLYGVLVGLEIADRTDAAAAPPAASAGAAAERAHSRTCVVGVAGFPALRETYWATRGAGAFRNGEPIRVSGVTRLADATVVTSDVKSQWYGDRFDGFVRLVGRAARQRGWGDCYGYALVASGRAEVMVDPLLNPWDIAALVPIIEEAGGEFFDWSGTPTIYGGSGIATVAALRAEVMAALRG